MISIYAPKYTLDDSLKNSSYDSFINVFRKLGEEKEIVGIAGDFSDHIGSNVEDYEDQHGAYS